MANRRPLIINSTAQQIQELVDADTLDGDVVGNLTGNVDGNVSGQVTLEGAAPGSASATGTAGDIRYDANYVYVCVATNTWKRSALATW